MVPVDPTTLRRLREHLLVSGHPDDPLFTCPDGRPLLPQYVTKHFQLLSKWAGLPVIRLHDLRHTSASLALAAGVDLKVVSDRLGHSTTTISADT